MRRGGGPPLHRQRGTRDLPREPAPARLPRRPRRARSLREQPRQAGAELRRRLARAEKPGLFPVSGAMPGVTQLGYLAFEVSDLEAWETFAVRILGLEVAAKRADGGFTLRMDRRAARFFITPGPANDLVCLGWETASAGDLESIVTRLRASGVAVREGGE